MAECKDVSDVSNATVVSATDTNTLNNEISLMIKQLEDRGHKVINVRLSTSITVSSTIFYTAMLICTKPLL